MGGKLLGHRKVLLYYGNSDLLIPRDNGGVVHGLFCIFIYLFSASCGTFVQWTLRQICLVLRLLIVPSRLIPRDSF